MGSLRKDMLVLLLVLPMCFAQHPSFAYENDVRWSNRVIQLAPQPERKKSPVVVAVAVQPGGALVAIAGDDHWVRLHNTRTGELIHVLKNHGDWVRSVAFSPDGRSLVTAGNDRRILLWSVQTGELQLELTTHENAITNIVFSHNGKLLGVSGFEHAVHLYDVPSGRHLKKLGCSCGDMRTVAFSPDDRLVAGGGRDGTVRLWEVSSGKHVRDIKPHRGRVRSIAFCHDGRHIASCGEDRQVCVSSVDGKQSYALPRRAAKVLSLAFYGDDKLATGGSDNVIRLWDIESREELGSLAGHLGSVATLACQNNVLVSGSYDTTVRVWQVSDREPGELTAPVGRFEESSEFRPID